MNRGMKVRISVEGDAVELAKIYGELTGRSPGNMLALAMEAYADKNPMRLSGVKPIKPAVPQAKTSKDSMLSFKMEVERQANWAREG